MITSMHTVIYSKDADADRAFFRDALGFSSIDAGGGWLIFAAPPAEIALHPAELNDRQELFLMCDNVDAQIAELAHKGVACAPISDEGWGRLTTISLPGGGKLGLYEPRHALAHGSNA